MASIKEITNLCKEGKISEAFQHAKVDLDTSPTDVWTQREMGWVLYYIIKKECETGDFEKLLECLDALRALDQLSVKDDHMIFDNVLLQIASFIKNRLPSADTDALSKLSTLFSRLKGYSFLSSRGHSFLLQTVIKYDNWPEMADFLDWWNLENLTSEDYVPYVNQKGQKMMTLAERAYIAQSKSLLKNKDLGRIEVFLPKLETLMNGHPEMMYPGYFYGKLLLALGSNQEEALKVLVPFARKKSTEFWVWQLLGDVFVNDEQKQLACLLRAVHCHTQESFLGKVRVRLAALYISRKQFNLARYQIDKVAHCYASHGWRLPYEIDCWIHQSWIYAAVPDDKDSTDYIKITDDILCNGAEEGLAIVTYVDPNSHKSYLVYGKEKKCVQRLRFKVKVGNVLKIHYILDQEKRVKVLNARKVQLSYNMDYVQFRKGTVFKKSDKDFAFVNVGSFRCFVSPDWVKRCNLSNGMLVKCLIVYDFDRKKGSWNWVCVDIQKMAL